MPKLGTEYILDRCPHCRCQLPRLSHVAHFQANPGDGGQPKYWWAYVCSRCAGAVVAYSHRNGQPGEVDAIAHFPRTDADAELDGAIPERARIYLKQAMSSGDAPAGAVLLAASAVDAMLKAIGYKDGSLYRRIDSAKTEGRITEGMAEWPHRVRLDANDERHADDDAPLATASDAKRSIDFAHTFGLVLFVLPSRVQRGLADTAEKK